MPQKSVRQTKLAQSKCNFRMFQRCSTVVRTEWPVLPTVYRRAELACDILSLSCVCATVVKGLPSFTFWLGYIWYKVWAFVGRRFRVEEQFLLPFCRFTLEWMVWWHLVWLFKTSFVSIGVHCWSWLSLPTGCSQTWYLTSVVCMCRTLNYMSDECPDFMA
jgi:hypothetical protein